MIKFLTDNWGTVLVGAILIAIVITAIIKIIKDKKSGKSSCGGDCSHCMMQCKDNKKKDE